MSGPRKTNPFEEAMKKKKAEEAAAAAQKKGQIQTGAQNPASARESIAAQLKQKAPGTQKPAVQNTAPKQSTTSGQAEPKSFTPSKLNKSVIASQLQDTMSYEDQERKKKALEMAQRSRQAIDDTTPISSQSLKQDTRPKIDLTGAKIDLSSAKPLKATTTPLQHTASTQLKQPQKPKSLAEEAAEAFQKRKSLQETQKQKPVTPAVGSTTKEEKNPWAGTTLKPTNNGRPKV